MDWGRFCAMKNAESMIKNKQLRGEWKSSLDQRHLLSYFFCLHDSSTRYDVKRIYGKFYELATSLSITPRVLAMKTWLDNSADTDDAIWGKLKRTRDGLLSWMAEETTAVLEEQKKSHKKEKKNKK
jgi:hypothetical protein